MGMMTDQLSAAHGAMLNGEIAISTAINALVPAALIWFLDVTPPQRLVGPDDLMRAIVPASGLATFIMTLVLTPVIRARVARGAVPPLAWPPVERRWYRLIPRNLALRALSLALLAILLLVPVTSAFVAFAGLLPLTKIGALIFNVVFGALVGLVMTRFVVLPALADGAAA